MDYVLHVRHSLHESFRRVFESARTIDSNKFFSALNSMDSDADEKRKKRLKNDNMNAALGGAIALAGIGTAAYKACSSGSGNAAQSSAAQANITAK
jgi:hypothetical protein